MNTTLSSHSNHHASQLIHRLSRSKLFLSSFLCCIFIIYALISAYLLYFIFFTSRWNLLTVPPGEATLEWDNGCPVTLVSFAAGIESQQISSNSNDMNPIADELVALKSGLLRLDVCMVLYLPGKYHGEVQEMWNSVHPDANAQFTNGNNSDSASTGSATSTTNNNARLILRDLNVEKVAKEWHLYEEVLHTVRVMWAYRTLDVQQQESVAIYKALQLMKPEILYKTSEENPFESKYFLWIDSDYGEQGALFSLIPEQTSWPDASKLHSLLKHNRDSLFMINLQNRRHLLEYCPEDNHMRAHEVSNIASGFFGGNAAAIKEMHGFYSDLSKSSLKNRLLSDESTLLHLAWCKKPLLFSLYQCPRARLCQVLGVEPCWDSFSCPVFALQDSRHAVPMQPFHYALSSYIHHHVLEWIHSVFSILLFSCIVVCCIIPAVALFFRKWWWHQRGFGRGLLPNYLELPTQEFQNEQELSERTGGNVWDSEISSEIGTGDELDEEEQQVR